MNSEHNDHSLWAQGLTTFVLYTCTFIDAHKSPYSTKSTRLKFYRSIKFFHLFVSKLFESILMIFESPEIIDFAVSCNYQYMYRYIIGTLGNNTEASLSKLYENGSIGTGMSWKALYPNMDICISFLNNLIL